MQSFASEFYNRSIGMSVNTRDRTITAPTAIASRVSFSGGKFSISEPDALNAEPPLMLFGLPLSRTSLQQAAQAIVARAKQGQTSIINFVNAHSINILHQSRRYSRALGQSSALLPDGAGIRLAARLAGKGTCNNLNGTDLFPLLCAEAAKQGQAMFLLGGASGIATKAARNMTDTISGLVISGTHDGYWHPENERDLIDSVNRSGAGILLVGLGVPLQEEWIARNRQKIKIPVIIGVGGLFDYYSDRIPRAPIWLRERGGEWLWRLMQEPRRLAGRYVGGNIAFILRALRHGWEARGYGDWLSHKSARMFDLLIALGALTALSPLLAAICLAIKCEDSGPVFFRQTRIGERGRPFNMWKFRSMAVDAEARRTALLAESERDGTCFKMKRDPRITRVGSFIRRASLDELPQLINVVKGDMSIVGPRPALPQEVITYCDRHRARLLGKPGITCIWQVSGRAEIPFEQQVVMDIRYLRRKSLRQDISLIARTIPAIVSGRGAY
jgi:exopolysaccharide biosynthesis WecB/TagA/CpsF family protein